MIFFGPTYIDKKCIPSVLDNKSGEQIVGGYIYCCTVSSESFWARIQYGFHDIVTGSGMKDISTWLDAKGFLGIVPCHCIGKHDDKSPCHWSNYTYMGVWEKYMESTFYIAQLYLTCKITKNYDIIKCLNGSVYKGKICSL